MGRSRQTGSRHLIVAVLAFVLTLTGVGRGFASMPAAEDARSAVLGLEVQICHHGAADAQGPASPADPAAHDCCDACALLAPALLPDPPRLAAPASAVYVAAPARGQAWRPATARARSPRQSQGPPEA